MNASKFFLKAANSLITAVVALFLILAAAYSGYALWDNAQVYAAVDDVQSELMKLKPDPEQKDGGASFEELRKINPDVCGWITLDHTKIDYPILQGEKTILLISIQMYMGNLLWQGVFFWTPAVTVLSDRNILFFMVTIWRIIRCSEIWIFTEKRNFLTKTPQVR